MQAELVGCQILVMGHTYFGRVACGFREVIIFQRPCGAQAIQLMEDKEGLAPEC